MLEAEEPGINATGKSGGVIASLPARVSPFEIINKYGEDLGRQLLSLYGNSGKYTFSLIQELGLDCSPQDSGFLAPARPGKELESLKSKSAEWQSFGFDIQYLDKKSITRLSGLDLYGGAILDPNGGGVNPLAFARELARVCAEKGVKLYTRSRVTGFSRVGESWRLKTSDGQLKAKKVILCAGGDNRGLHGDLEKSVMPLNVFQFSTEPLSERIRETLLPDDHSLTDVHTDIFTMRFDRDGRLITACPAFLSSNTKDRAIYAVTQRLKRISPLLNSVRIEDIWQGTAWLGTSLLPKFCDHSEGLYSIQACNGRGLAVNTLLGREVAQFIQSSAYENSSLLVSQPDFIHPYGLMRHAPNLFISAVRCRNLVIEKLKTRIRGS